MPKAWPNLRIIVMDGAALSRDGELIATAHDNYHMPLERQPELAGFMIQTGREREAAASKVNAI